MTTSGQSCRVGERTAITRAAVSLARIASICAINWVMETVMMAHPAAEGARLP